MQRQGGSLELFCQHGVLLLQTMEIHLSSALIPLSGPLHQLLPLRFPGGFVLEHMSDECNACHQDIPMEQWHAEISPLGAKAVVIAMTATCEGCKTPAALKARIRAQDDGTAKVDCESPTGWKHFDAEPVSARDRVRYHPESAGFLDRVISLAKQVCRLRD